MRLPTTFETHDEGSATRQSLERAMAEGKRIRMDALAAAEQSHRALVEATRLKCDEMVAAAREEAATIIDAARREVQRIHAQAAVEAPTQLAEGNQTSAQMVLEMAFEEAAKIVTQAADDAERLRESIVADARASAMEIIRDAEIEAAGRWPEARLQMEMLRDHTKRFYDKLCNVAGQMPESPVITETPGATPTTALEAELAVTAQPDPVEVTPVEAIDAAAATAGEAETPASERAEETVTETSLPTWQPDFSHFPAFNLPADSVWRDDLPVATLAQGDSPEEPGENPELDGSSADLSGAETQSSAYPEPVSIEFGSRRESDPEMEPASRTADGPAGDEEQSPATDALTPRLGYESDKQERPSAESAGRTSGLQIGLQDSLSAPSRKSERSGLLLRFMSSRD